MSTALATIRDELARDERRVGQMTDHEHAWFENAKRLLRLVDDITNGVVCPCGAATWTGRVCNACGGMRGDPRHPDADAPFEPEADEETAAIATITYARRRGSKLVHHYRNWTGEAPPKDWIYDRSVCGKRLGLHCKVGPVVEGEKVCQDCAVLDAVGA
jgi:hypothetical protein